jgi:hypothetical protein
MKRSIATLLLAFVTAVSIMGLVAPPAAAQTETVVFTAQLLSGNEVPPIANAEAGANGTVIITFTLTRSGGVITAASATFEFIVNNLQPNSVVILAHIHRGVAGVNGPIVVDSGLSPATPIPAVNGTVTFSRSGLALSPSLAQEIINNPSGFYFNVHTVLNPGGVVRGQLVPQQQGGGQPGIGAPTLSEWGMILMTLLIVAAGTFFLMKRGGAMSVASAGASTFDGPAMAVDFGLLAKVTLVIEAVVAVALLALKADPVDVAGALASGLIVAFIVHLFIGNARRR